MAATETKKIINCAAGAPIPQTHTLLFRDAAQTMPPCTEYTTQHKLTDSKVTERITSGTRKAGP